MSTRHTMVYKGEELELRKEWVVYDSKGCVVLRLQEDSSVDEVKSSTIDTLRRFKSGLLHK